MSTTRDAGAGVRFRVVVVDDDFHVARLHTRIVESVEGFGVVATAGTAAQAAAVIDAEDPDLVLADIYLPDGSGLDLIARRDVDAIVLSAAVATAAVRKALQRGAFGYLIKPFADDDLTELLRAYGRYRNLVDSQAELDQEAVDRARRVLHGAGARDGASRRSPTRGTSSSSSGTARRGAPSTATARRGARSPREDTISIRVSAERRAVIDQARGMLMTVYPGGIFPGVRRMATEMPEPCLSVAHRQACPGSHVREVCSAGHSLGPFPRAIEYRPDTFDIDDSRSGRELPRYGSRPPQALRGERGQGPPRGSAGRGLVRCSVRPLCRALRVSAGLGW